MKMLLEQTLTALLVAFIPLLLTPNVLGAKGRHKRQNKCPSVEQLERQLHLPDMDASFYQYPPLLNSQDTLTLEEFKQREGTEMVQIKRSSMHADSPVCTAEAQEDKGMPLRPCPVKWVLNYDANRVPSTLMEAQCECSDCVGVNRSVHAFTKDGLPLDTPLGCSGITYYTKVMRKTGDNCKYEKVLEPLIVGCACQSESVRVVTDSPPIRVHSQGSSASPQDSGVRPANP